MLAIMNAISSLLLVCAVCCKQSGTHPYLLGSIFVLGVLLSLFTIQWLNRMAHARQLFAKMNERTVHKSTIPRLAGLAFLPLMAILVVLGVWMEGGLWRNEVEAQLASFPGLLLLFSACFVLYIVGAADDLFTLSYRSKFAAQALSIFMVLAWGKHIESFHGMFGIYELPSLVGAVLTFFFLLWVINAINLIDGIDGLAGGVALIAFVFFGIFLYVMGKPIYVLICVSIVSVLLGYLRFNLWGTVEQRNKIFMGDTGSLTLGLLLGFMALTVWNSSEHPPLEGAFAESFASAPIALGVSPLFIPCMDLLHVMIVRVLRHQNPFQPDKTHIHHRLMALGLSQRQTLVVLLSCSVLLTLVNVLARRYFDVGTVASLDVALWLLGNAIIQRFSSTRV